MYLFIIFFKWGLYTELRVLQNHVLRCWATVDHEILDGLYTTTTGSCLLLKRALLELNPVQ